VYGARVSVYIAACRRHIMKYYNGEWEDKKTKVPHLASALACLAIIVDGVVKGNLVDDRPPRVERLSEYMDTIVPTFVKHLKDLYPDKVGRYTQEGLDD